MQSGQEMLDEAVAVCKQIADGLASQAGIQIMMAGDRFVSQGIPAFSSTIA